MFKSDEMHFLLLDVFYMKNDGKPKCYIKKIKENVANLSILVSNPNLTARQVRSKCGQNRVVPVDRIDRTCL